LGNQPCIGDRLAIRRCGRLDVGLARKTRLLDLCLC
jgi:hypothetical protein